MYPLVSTGGAVEGNFLEVTKVVIRNATKLIQCLFDLLLYCAYIRVLLGPTELTAIVANNQGNASLGRVLFAFLPSRLTVRVYVFHQRLLDLCLQIGHVLLCLPFHFR